MKSTCWRALYVVLSRAKSTITMCSSSKLVCSIIHAYVSYMAHTSWSFMMFMLMHTNYLKLLILNPNEGVFDSHKHCPSLVVIETSEHVKLLLFKVLIKATPESAASLRQKRGELRPWRSTNNNKQNNNCFVSISWPTANRADPIVPQWSSSRWEEKCVTARCMWLLHNKRSSLHSRGRAASER